MYVSFLSMLNDFGVLIDRNIFIGYGFVFYYYVFLIIFLIEEMRLIMNIYRFEFVWMV